MVGELYIPSAIEWRVLDLPLLRCGDCCPGYWIVASRASPRERWGGAQVFVSRDNTIFDVAATITNEAILGLATTVLGDVESCYRGYWDRVNTIDVDISSPGILTGITEDEVLAGKNRALVGQEIIGFRDVEQTDAYSYRLSTLLRGRRDTLTTGHVIYEQFTLLDPDQMFFVPVDVGEIGSLRYFRAVPNAGKIANFPSAAYTAGGSVLRPFSPVNVLGVRDASNNLTLSWTPRYRTPFRLLGPAYPSECGWCGPFPSFEVDIYGTNWTTLLRTIEVPEAVTTIYTAAQQTADGLTPGNSVYLDVYQMSKAVGRGNQARYLI